MQASRGHHVVQTELQFLNPFPLLVLGALTVSIPLTSSFLSVPHHHPWEFQAPRGSGPCCNL